MPADYSLGKIYKIINSVNDKVYIGSTTRKYLSSRMSNHRADAKRCANFGKLYRAMNKIGSDKFSIELIEDYSCESKAELEAREYSIMKKYKKNSTELYNSTSGDGHSEETKEKMRKSHKGKKASDETKEKLRKINTGKKISDETKARMSQAQKKRGSVRFDTKNNNWRFMWYEDRKHKAKCFSVKKFGYDSAYRKVIRFQNEIYPIEE